MSYITIMLRTPLAVGRGGRLEDHDIATTWEIERAIQGHSGAS